MIDMIKDWFEDFRKLKSWVKVLAVVILVVLLHHWVLHQVITTTSSLSVLIKPRIIGSKGRNFQKNFHSER